MNTSKLWPLLVEGLPVLFLAGIFLFALGSAIYMIGINFYGLLKPGRTQEPSLQKSKTLRNLLVATIFFSFVGVVATVVGIHTWLQQPFEREQAFLMVISAIWFFALAMVAYKKRERY